MMKKQIYISIPFIIVISFVLSCCSNSKQTERLFSHFLNNHVEKTKSLNKKYYQAMWETYTGKRSFSDLIVESEKYDSLYNEATQPPEYYESLLRNVYDNTSDFEMLLRIKKSGLIQDPLLKRQFIKVFREYVNVKNNWDDSNRKRAELLEQFYNLKKTDSDFWKENDRIDEEEYRTKWINRYTALEGDFKEMIKALNNDVKKIGYDNYFQLLLDRQNISIENLDKITQVINRETRNDFRKLMLLCEKDIVEEFNISNSEIKPHHYSYGIKKMYVPTEWDKTFNKDECLSIVSEFFMKGNFDVSDIIEKSDLWYSEDKISQSFFACLDPEKNDFRVYSNIKPNTYGIYHILHEFAHAIHQKYVDPSVPYLLREPNVVTSEAFAIYFNDKIYHSSVFREMMGVNDQSEMPYFKHFSNPSRLFFIRQLLRNIEFERRIFENPECDFNELWWTLNEKYMNYSPDDKYKIAEWTTNRHIINISGIHVFYLYAFAFAAQLEEHYPEDQISLLNERLIKYGDTQPWNELLENATGEKLNINYLLNSYKNSNFKYLKPPEIKEIKETSMIEDLDLIYENKLNQLYFQSVLLINNS